MALIVQKFGGSSVADAARVMNVARIVTDTYKAGNDVVVVVSAQGDTTDDLIAKAQEINPNAAKREIDQLLTAGEQISISLLAMAIEKLGYPVISLLGWQAGFNTNSVYGSARIKNIKTNRLQAELAKHNIVVVAGFQGLNRYDDLTTLGRGGSDTSAVESQLPFMRTDAKSSPMLRAFTPQIPAKLRVLKSLMKSLTTKCSSLPLSARRCSITARLKWLKNILLNLKFFHHSIPFRELSLRRKLKWKKCLSEA